MYFKTVFLTIDQGETVILNGFDFKDRPHIRDLWMKIPHG